MVSASRRAQFVTIAAERVLNIVAPGACKERVCRLIQVGVWRTMGLQYKRPSGLALTPVRFFNLDNLEISGDIIQESEKADERSGRGESSTKSHPAASARAVGRWGPESSARSSSSNATPRLTANSQRRKTKPQNLPVINGLDPLVLTRFPDLQVCERDMSSFVQRASGYAARWVCFDGAGPANVGLRRRAGSTRPSPFSHASAFNVCRLGTHLALSQI